MTDTYIYTRIIIRDTSNEKITFNRCFENLHLNTTKDGELTHDYGFPFNNAIKDLINYDMLKDCNQTFYFNKAGTEKPIEQISPFTI